MVQEPRRLLAIPRNPSVNQIIEDFLAHKKEKADQEQYEKYCSLFYGLKNFFNRTLSTILLYRQEREQYLLAKRYGAPSEVYGAEHLLRLFSKLPNLFVNVSLLPTDINQIQNKLSELLKFIQKYCDKYLDISLYVLASEPNVLLCNESSFSRSNLVMETSAAVEESS